MSGKGKFINAFQSMQMLGGYEEDEVKKKDELCDIDSINEEKPSYGKDENNLTVGKNKLTLDQEKTVVNNGDELYNPLEDMDEGSDQEESGMIISNSPNITNPDVVLENNVNKETQESNLITAIFPDELEPSVNNEASEEEENTNDNDDEVSKQEENIIAELDEVANKVNISKRSIDIFDDTDELLGTALAELEQDEREEELKKLMEMENKEKVNADKKSKKKKKKKTKSKDKGAKDDEKKKKKKKKKLKEKKGDDDGIRKKKKKEKKKLKEEKVKMDIIGSNKSIDKQDVESKSEIKNKDKKSKIKVEESQKSRDKKVSSDHKHRSRDKNKEKKSSDRKRSSSPEKKTKVSKDRHGRKRSSRDISEDRDHKKSRRDENLHNPYKKKPHHDSFEQSDHKRSHRENRDRSSHSEKDRRVSSPDHKKVDYEVRVPDKQYNKSFDSLPKLSAEEFYNIQNKARSKENKVMHVEKHHNSSSESESENKNSLHRSLLADNFQKELSKYREEILEENTGKHDHKHQEKETYQCKSSSPHSIKNRSNGKGDSIRSPNSSAPQNTKTAKNYEKEKSSHKLLSPTRRDEITKNHEKDHPIDKRELLSLHREKINKNHEKDRNKRKSTSPHRERNHNHDKDRSTHKRLSPSRRERTHSKSHEKEKSAKKSTSPRRDRNHPHHEPKHSLNDSDDDVMHISVDRSNINKDFHETDMKVEVSIPNEDNNSDNDSVKISKYHTTIFDVKPDHEESELKLFENVSSGNELEDLTQNKKVQKAGSLSLHQYKERKKSDSRHQEHKSDRRRSHSGGSNKDVQDNVELKCEVEVIYKANLSDDDASFDRENKENVPLIKKSPEHTVVTNDYWNNSSDEKKRQQVNSEHSDKENNIKNESSSIPLLSDGDSVKFEDNHQHERKEISSQSIGSENELFAKGGDSPYNPEVASPLDLASPNLDLLDDDPSSVDFHAYKDVVAFEDIMKSKVKHEAKKHKRRKLEEMKTELENRGAANKEHKLVDYLLRQAQVEEEMKNVLKQYFKNREITKEEYKNILKKAVPQVTMSGSAIVPEKIHSLMTKFVRKCKGQRIEADRKRCKTQKELAEQQKQLQLQLQTNAAMLGSFQPFQQIRVLNPNLPMPPL